jgi:hypothetical protein
MVWTFIKIRTKQIFRAIEEIGLLRVVFLIGLLGYLTFGMFIQLSKVPNLYYTTGAYFGVILLIHINRSDKIFLKTHFDKHKFIYLVEYLLLTLPLILCLLYYQQWCVSGLLYMALLIVINWEVKVKHRSLNTKIQKLIPHDCFEWKSGIRKTYALIVVLFVLGLGTSFFIGSVPVVIFILGILPFSFYEKGESLQMILVFEMNPNRFLRHKVEMQLFLFSVLVLPLILAFLIFHYERWYIPVIEYFIFVSLHIYVILTKYAFYEPNQKSGAAQIFGTIGAMGMIIPVFIPVIWFLSIRFYFKSKNKLNFYLSDYN